MVTALPRAVDIPHDADLLQGLKPAEIDLILAAARPRWLSAKSVITRQDEPADHLMMLWKGRARYFYGTPDGKKLILRWITPGEIFAAAALVSQPSNYLASTEAVRDSVVLVWDGTTIRSLSRRFPQVMENVLIFALDHFAWYLSAYATLASKTAQERLANLLVALAPSIGEKTPAGIEINVTNEELANSVNISLYSASRMISEWHRTGAIRKHRGKILLRSPKRFFLRVV